MNNLFINESKMLDSIVPISRFNKGEAIKIFDEVDKTGVKIVVDNDKPCAVIISPEKYKEMMKEIEDYELCIKTGKRIENTTSDVIYVNNKKEKVKSDDIPINAIKEIIKSELSQLSYDTWIATCEGAIEGDILRWFCPNTFTQDIVDKRYAKLILNACKLLELNIKEVKFLVDKE